MAEGLLDAGSKKMLLTNYGSQGAAEDVDPLVFCYLLNA